MMENPLKPYSLGECIGKGAFGAVYKAFNMENGKMYAIKQIQLRNIPESELSTIMMEIDLMKALHQEHIVKYYGSIKTSEYLNIILEFCENGSLQDVCRKFGKFPEPLVSRYMSQVLKGLIYLHDRSVLHRDIKGANILSNKDGLVKLADFGVATRLDNLDHKSIVGSPYWIAPEVIQRLGATTAADIWSLGCTIIELLEGRPPYANCQPLEAMKWMVKARHPTLPIDISPELKDFLMQCFQRDFRRRVTAKQLLSHPWIKTYEHALENHSVCWADTLRDVQIWNERFDTQESPSHPHGSDDNDPWERDIDVQGLERRLSLHPRSSSASQPHAAPGHVPSSSPLAASQRRSVPLLPWHYVERADEEDRSWDRDIDTCRLTDRQWMERLDRQRRPSSQATSTTSSTESYRETDAEDYSDVVLPDNPHLLRARLRHLSKSSNNNSITSSSSNTNATATSTSTNASQPLPSSMALS